jgi:hypothetical protein
MSRTPYLGLHRLVIVPNTKRVNNRLGASSLNPTVGRAEPQLPRIHPGLDACLTHPATSQRDRHQARSGSSLLARSGSRW